MTKAECARRQLGVALWLFLNGQCNASAMTLAVAGLELAEELAKKKENHSFATNSILHSGLKKHEWRTATHLFANALKHAKDKAGQERRDDALLQSLDSSEVAHRLMIGWHDYAMLDLPYPIEAHLFLGWYAAVFNIGESKQMAKVADYYFPYIRLERSFNQKLRRLNRIIFQIKADGKTITHPTVDRRPLILPE